MLSIGKLAPGQAAGDYYLARAAGCPAEYYLGHGEAAGVWLGEGAKALGLHGRLDTAEAEVVFRRLLAGESPTGEVLAKPVLRGDPRSRVPAARVVQAVMCRAEERGVDVETLLAPRRSTASAGAEPAGGLVAHWNRAVGDLGRARRRPVWPAPTLPAATAERLLRTAGLDPHVVLSERTPTGRVRDLLARALRHRDARVDVRLPGLDLTFSAPKSVSLLWALSDDPPRSGARPAGRPAAPGAADDVGSQVRAAHRVAVQQSLAYLELHCTEALRGHHRGDGTDTRLATDGLIAAGFDHRSSRCGDPQLHTHVVVANLLHGADGRWSALNSRELYQQARTAGFVYQAVLRGELTRRLGVTWAPVRNGQAEIAGVPDGLLRVFSKRRRQIEARLEELGLEGPSAAQAATLDTRPAKARPADASVPAEASGLQDRWRAEALAAGFAPSQLERVLHRPASQPLIAAARATGPAGVATGPAAKDVTEALLSASGLTQKRASFDRRDLLRGVCEHLPPGLPITLTGLRAMATRVLRDDRVVPLLGDAPVSARRYSTRELLEVETEALALATLRPATPGAGDATADVDTARKVPATLPAARLGAPALAAAERQAVARGCTPEQLAMLRRLLTSGAGVEVVVGAAGAGKTTALAVAAAAWRRAGLPVHGTALAAIAARVLQDSSGIPSRSLQRLLNEVDSAGTGKTVMPAGGVLVVDEAGMVGTRSLHRLLALAAEHDTKLVLVGDPRQLPEIDAGGLFATLAARLPTTTLLGNQRQASRWEQRALRELRQGDVLRALSAYAGRGRLRIEDDVPALTARLLEDYDDQLARYAPEQVLVIASSRGDARRLNVHLRQRLLDHGRLGAAELRVALTDDRDGAGRGERGYRLGEQVLVTVNDYPRGVLNGTRGTVTSLSIEHQSVTVRLDDGRHVDLDRQYLSRGQLSHGYALTAHKAQGVTVDVSLLWGTQSLTRETGYVALSRGRQANFVYATWDLLRRDADVVGPDDLDRPLSGRRAPRRADVRLLGRAALAQRMDTSGQQRTARSWQSISRPRPPRAAAGRGRGD